MAETINGGNDVDTLDLQVFQAIGAIDLTTVTIIDIEVLALWSNDVTLTSAQVDGFSSIIGTGFTERLILSDGGLVDLSGANLSSIDELRGNAFINQINLAGVATGQFVNSLGGDDSILGGGGADRIDGGTGNDSIVDGDGFDTLIGGDDSDTVLGGNGNDLIYNGSGSDQLSGEAGNDVFRITLVGEISGLAEIIDGGVDVDTLDFQTDLADGSASIVSVTLTSIETLLLGNTQLTLSAVQLGGFTTIAGTGYFESLILSGSGTADLSGATVSSIEEIRGSGGANTVILSGIA